MIQTPFLGKVVALAVAIAAHGSLVLVLAAQPQPALIEAMGESAEIRLGNAFEDMAAGTLGAQPATAVTEPLQNVTAEVVPQQPLPAETTPEPPPEPIKPPPETPVPNENTVLTEAQRPAPRKAKPAERKKPAPQPAREVRTASTKPAPEAGRQRGNGAQQTRAGEATGKREARATKSGNGGRQQEAAGNAAASNYPGLVMGKLSRAGKPDISARGSAIVAFSIADGGGLASVSLARSSGSASLDNAAIRLVRNAAPFPPPPQGARRSMSIEIRGR